MIRASVFAILLLSVVLGGAAPTSGMYEVWSSIDRRPVAPLKGKVDRGRIGGPSAWLKVKTTGQVSIIDFEPGGSVQWVVRWGPHGVTAKDTLVDGQLWTRSLFRYDGAGRLTHKTVAGVGVAGDSATKPQRPLTFQYRHDRRGRVIERRGLVRRRGTTGGWVEEVWTVAYTRGGGAQATLSLDGIVVRRERFDSGGRPVELVVGKGAGELALRYRRHAAGGLRGLDRRWGRGRWQPVNLSKPPLAVTATHIKTLAESWLRRQEVLLLVGPATTSSRDGRGSARTVVDTYSKECWLNTPSSLRYGPTGLLKSSAATCICGFCVDAAAPVQSSDAEVKGEDLHWTDGPWVRLTFTGLAGNRRSVDVTSEHAMVTPSGPVPAGRLVAGGEVIGALWETLILTRVEVLPRGPLRLGRNLRTHSGTFAAGGLRLESERPCGSVH